MRFEDPTLSVDELRHDGTEFTGLEVDRRHYASSEECVDRGCRVHAESMNDIGNEHLSSVDVDHRRYPHVHRMGKICRALLSLLDTRGDHIVVSAYARNDSLSVVGLPFTSKPVIERSTTAKPRPSCLRVGFITQHEGSAANASARGCPLPLGLSTD
jgi:hypothetical protein